VSLSILREAQALVRIRPDVVWFAPGLVTSHAYGSDRHCAAGKEVQDGIGKSDGEWRFTLGER